MKRALAALLLSLAGAATAAADPARPDPIGALGASSELPLTGGGPRQRFGAHATYFVTHRAGVHLSLAHATFDGAAGQLTAGLAYRAAIARPRIELDVHADAGLAWPTAPALGGGVITYFWPVKRLPLAITSGLRAYAIVDGVDSRLAISLEIGVAVAR